MFVLATVRAIEKWLKWLNLWPWSNCIWETKKYLQYMGWCRLCEVWRSMRERGGGGKKRGRKWKEQGKKEERRRRTWRRKDQNKIRTMIAFPGFVTRFRGNTKTHTICYLGTGIASVPPGLEELGSILSSFLTSAATELVGLWWHPVIKVFCLSWDTRRFPLNNLKVKLLRTKFSWFYLRDHKQRICRCSMISFYTAVTLSISGRGSHRLWFKNNRQ